MDSGVGESCQVGSQVSSPLHALPCSPGKTAGQSAGLPAGWPLNKASREWKGRAGDGLVSGTVSKPWIREYFSSQTCSSAFEAGDLSSCPFLGP